MPKWWQKQLCWFGCFSLQKHHSPNPPMWHRIRKPKYMVPQLTDPWIWSIWWIAMLYWLVSNDLDHQYFPCSMEKCRKCWKSEILSTIFQIWTWLTALEVCLRRIEVWRGPQDHEYLMHGKFEQWCLLWVVLKQKTDLKSVEIDDKLWSVNNHAF